MALAEEDGAAEEAEHGAGVADLAERDDAAALLELEVEEVAEGRTRIDVTMNYADPPGGRIGEVVADAVSNPEREMREDLENFARRIERGELNLSGPGAQAGR